MGFTTFLKKIGSWLGGIFTFLGKNTPINEFLSDYGPLALKVVENVSGMDLDNDGKRSYAKDELLKELASKSVKWRDHYINLLIELAVAQLKDSGK